jgi:hypothetical protein
VIVDLTREVFDEPGEFALRGGGHRTRRHPIERPPDAFETFTELGAGLHPGQIHRERVLRRGAHVADRHHAEPDEDEPHQGRHGDDCGHAQAKRHGCLPWAGGAHGAGSRGVRSFWRCERCSSISRKSVAGATVLTGT